MFYRTSIFRTKFGNYGDEKNDEYTKTNLPGYYFDLQSIDYNITEEKIVMTIKFVDKTVVEEVTRADIDLTHDGSAVGVIYDVNSVDMNRARLRIIEWYQVNQNTKSHPANYAQRGYSQFKILQIIVPSLQDSLLNMDYVVNMPPSVEVTSNLEIINRDEPIKYRHQLVKLNFVDEVPTSMSKNDVLELRFNTFWHDEQYFLPMTLYPKARQGYVNKTKVTTVDGIGTFKFAPLYLDPGDVAEVEVGYKHRTNALNAKILITE